MTRGTTPTITLTINEIDLTALQSIYITFRQGGTCVTKQSGDSGVEINAHTVEITLTQAETLNFNTGKCEVQLRGLTADGKAIATCIAKTCIHGILLEGEIT